MVALTNNQHPKDGLAPLGNLSAARVLGGEHRRSPVGAEVVFPVKRCRFSRTRGPDASAGADASTRNDRGVGQKDQPKIHSSLSTSVFLPLRDLMDFKHRIGG